MTSYLTTNTLGEIFFPFKVDNGTVDMVWRNVQLNRDYNVSLIISSTDNRGFSTLVTVTGTESEPYSVIDGENFTTSLNIPSGDYNVECLDENGINRIVMVHVNKTADTTIYTTEQNNVIYNG